MFDRHGVHSPSPQAPQGRVAARRTQHELAVGAIQAEHVARVLRPYGILNREALKAAAGAQQWREGTFAGALSRAIDMGLIEVCPLGYFRYGRESRHRHERR